jgi:hypothetical protein
VKAHEWVRALDYSLMQNLARFEVKDVLEYDAVLREMDAGASSMEEVAVRTVRFLYDHLGSDVPEARACALVRFFKTHPYQALAPDLRAVARKVLGEEPADPSMKCLTLLGTAGELPEWNSRRQSAGHRAIPLASEATVERSPMISQLIRQFGFDVRTVLQTDPDLIMERDKRRYNVFHVPEALGSPYVPAQESFVIPFGIQSVLGFGSMLPSGDLFAVILFSRIHIPRYTAEHFRLLALSVRRALMRFTNDQVFSH